MSVSNRTRPVRKKATEGGREPEDRFKTIIDAIPILAWTARPDGSAEFFNQRWLDYTGLSSPQALDWAWAAAIHPGDRDAVMTAWRSILASGEQLEIEARMRRFDGEHRWFLIRASGLRDEQGKLVRWYGTNTEIEDRRRAEQAVRVSEENFRLIVESLPGMVSVTTTAGELEFVNRQFGEYFAKSLEELKAWETTDIAVHPDDLDRVIATWKQGLASGQLHELEHRLRRADGVYRWFHYRNVPLRDADGRIVRWYGLATDIEDLKRVEETSRASESSLRLLIDSIPGLVYTMTPACGLELVNYRVLEYFGRTFEELKDWDRIGVVHPDDLPRVLDSLKRTVEFGEAHEVEQRLLGADGVYRWFKPRGLALRGPDGGIARWYCLLTDVDDLKRAEEALRSAQARLSRATHLATVSELSASIAHEIQQPLAAVVASGHACHRWLSIDPPNVERAVLTVDRIIDAGNFAADVIRRIRSLFRHAPLVKHALNMNEVIREVCGLMIDDLRTSGVFLKTDLQGDLPPANADRVQMQQVVANLARNGIEAMESVTERPKELLIASRHDGGEVAVRVSDQGVGISEPDAVFEPFYTTKSDGMGMGLAICRSIIDAHGGRLWATHNTPHGMTFGFALRISEDDAR